jgi:hypothetical protein
MKIGEWTIFEKVKPIIIPTAKRERVSNPSKTTEASSSSITSVRTYDQRTDKIPHPKNMDQYDDLNCDSEVGTAINVLSNMSVGSGFYTEMDEEVKPDHPNKKIIDEWADKVNLDETAAQIERIRIGKGFCPVEILKDYDLKILPPETFYLWRKPTGEIYKYSQEYDSKEYAKWEELDLHNILLFKRFDDPSHPYGQAIVDNIVSNIRMRRQMSEDIPDVIHKFAWPFRVWEADTKEIMDVVYSAATGRQVDEDIFIENIMKEQLRIHTETQDPRINFTEYVIHNDEQIAEALHAPLLIYLRNATEASATTMLEAIELDVQGSQRYNKRRYEMLFKRIVGDPSPKLIWGSTKTGLEDLTLLEITDCFQKGAISFTQVQDLLKKLGLPIIAEEEPVQKPMTMPGTEIPGMPPMGSEEPIPLGLQTQLNTLEILFKDKKITLKEALEEGGMAISSQVDLMKRNSIKSLKKMGVVTESLPSTSNQWYNDLANSIQTQFKNRLIPDTKSTGTIQSNGRTFKVEVLD